MKDMIKEIVQTDKTARLEVEKAAARRDMLAKEIDEQTKSFEAKCAEEANAKIQTAGQQLDKKLEESTKRIEAQTLEKCEALKAEFEKNHTEWESRIFDNIIGG